MSANRTVTVSRSPQAKYHQFRCLSVSASSKNLVRAEICPRAVERLGAFQTELCGCRILRVARRAAAREWRRAFDAEPARSGFSTPHFEQRIALLPLDPQGASGPCATPAKIAHDLESSGSCPTCAICGLAVFEHWKISSVPRRERIVQGLALNAAIASSVSTRCAVLAFAFYLVSQCGFGSSAEIQEHGGKLSGQN